MAEEIEKEKMSFEERFFVGAVVIFIVVVSMGALFLFKMSLSGSNIGVSNYCTSSTAQFADCDESISALEEEETPMEDATPYDSSSNGSSIGSGEYGPETEPEPEPEEVCDIKGNISFTSGEKIYHLPGGDYYAKTEINESQGERYFCSEKEARDAGWRKSEV